MEHREDCGAHVAGTNTAKAQAQHREMYVRCSVTVATRLGTMTLPMPFQNVIPAEVSLVCVVKPDEFWDKKVTHFCFWKEKDRLGFEVSPLAKRLSC